MPNQALSTPRRRGAFAGLALMLLGAWGALVAVVGPLFDYAYTPDAAWTMTYGRWILQVLPGAAVFVGGLVLLVATTRVAGLVGGLLAAAGGAWFVLGPILVALWDPTGTLPGQPLGTGLRAMVEQIGIFVGLGVVILFLAAMAIGRFTLRGHRDAEAVDAARERRLRRRRAHTATATLPGPGPAAATPVADSADHVRLGEGESEARATRSPTTSPDPDVPDARHGQP